MARKEYENPQLDMTPMIDVVFELIIFFVVTIKAEDILSKLNANRPAPSTSNVQKEENDEQITIDVGPGGFVFKGRGCSPKQLDRYLQEVASISTKSMVLVRCTLDSPHKLLVQALDTCYKHKLHSVSIFSM